MIQHFYFIFVLGSEPQAVLRACNKALEVLQHFGLYP